MRVKIKSAYVLILIVIFATSCSFDKTALPPTPSFVTAVLPTPVPIQPTPAIEISAPVLVANTPTPPPLVEGTTTTQLNVRAEPDKDSAALGVLNIFDKVQIFGKDASGAWYRILYAESFGWVSAEYVQINSGIEIPFIATEEPTAESIIVPPTESSPTALQDGDSMQAPLATIIFSPAGARSLQLNGDVSAPNGDFEDWLQFTSYSRVVKIRIQCSGIGVYVELWQAEARVDGFPLACGGVRLLTVTSNSNYHLRFSAPNSNEFHYVNYEALIEGVQ